MSTESNSKRLVTQDQIVLASILGGPLSACYLAGRNHMTLGNPKRAKRWYFSGAIITAIFFPILLTVIYKLNIDIPGFIIPLMYTFIIMGIFSYTQEKTVKEKLQADWQKYSWLKVIGVTLLGLGLLTIYLLITFILLPESFLA